MKFIALNGVVLRLRLPANELSYRRRFLRLTSNRQVEMRRMRSFMAFLMVKIRTVINNAVKVKMKRVLKLLAMKYLELSVEPQTELEPLEHPHITIEYFSDSNCPIFFGFLKTDLARLRHLLRFPQEVTFSNRATMSGEEIMLRGLYELVSGETQHKIATNVFGRELTVQSRAFSWFIHHIWTEFHHLVNNNLDWWFRNGFFASSAEAIGRKINMGQGVHNPVAHFIDCNCFETDRPGGGPAEAGANALRWDPDIQRAFYNGWKSIHGLKHQTVDNAYGLTVDMYGPESLRRHDLTLLTDSDINNRMAAVQLGAPVQYIMFGDSAYFTKSHLAVYLKDYDGVADFIAWNLAMKRVRQSIEWNYGVTASKFKYVQNHYKLKILHSDNVAKVYTVATIFRNLNVGLYGGQCSNYFNLRLPDNFIEHYINQVDF